MKQPLYKYLSYLIVFVFLIYWILIVILSTPPNRIKIFFENKLPAFYNLFAYNWKFFSPPFTYNDRMYVIVKNDTMPYNTDTIELLQPIAFQKQREAPLNGNSNIKDMMVNFYVGHFKTGVCQHRNELQKIFPGKTDSFYLVKSSEAAINDPALFDDLLTLKNYCKQVAKNETGGSANKEYKMIIAEESIRPYNEMDNGNFVSSKQIVFETGYNTFDK